MKPCPNCGRVGTVHYTFENKCYGCSPPDPKDVELVIFTYMGHNFYVERRDLNALQSLVDHSQVTYRNGRVSYYVDTGKCERDALVVVSKTVEQWLGQVAPVISVMRHDVDELKRKHDLYVASLIQ